MWVVTHRLGAHVVVMPGGVHQDEWRTLTRQLVITINDEGDIDVDLGDVALDGLL